ncbi:MAG: DUF2141 domain-containing protein [Bacteroidales bacterium]|nr:DUF2141 domain-containing protein [Bacteroidales bacterium]
MEIMHAFYSEKLKKFWLITSITLLIFLVSTVVNAQETYTITGVCKVQDEGILYIFLVDAEHFKKQMSGLQRIVQKVELNKKRIKEIPFEFKGVVKGIYGIRCFIDKDGNSKLNYGFLGPSEPWGMSSKERLKGIPSFSDISFKVENTVNDVIIQIK